MFEALSHRSCIIREIKRFSYFQTKKMFGIGSRRNRQWFSRHSGKETDDRFYLPCLDRAILYGGASSWRRVSSFCIRSAISTHSKKFRTTKFLYLFYFFSLLIFSVLEGVAAYFDHYASNGVHDELVFQDLFEIKQSRSVGNETKSNNFLIPLRKLLFYVRHKHSDKPS